jgi:hypothetical protein
MRLAVLPVGLVVAFVALAGAIAEPSMHGRFTVS